MTGCSVRDVEELETLLSEPTEGVIKTMSELRGDIIVLGVSGKMGPSLARMAKRASDGAGINRRVIGVSRFTKKNSETALNAFGIDTIKCEMLDGQQLESLPDVPNVVYMAGMKFGSTGNESLTWATNTYLPGMVAQKYRNSKIVAFSTGNIYGLNPVVWGGPRETDPLRADGDYAQSCLGRERILEHFSRTQETPMSIIRLNYANELRYGVLVDLAKKVYSGEVIDITMGAVNVIWQGDANAMSLMSFNQASHPPFVVNVAGPEIMSVRRICEEFGSLMGKPVSFTGTEAHDALLSNGQLAHKLYGYPKISTKPMMEMIADWVMRGEASLGKPTSFEARDGKY